MSNKIIILFLLLTCKLNASIIGSVEVGNEAIGKLGYTDIKITYQFYTGKFQHNIYGENLTWFTYEDYNDNDRSPFRNIYTIGYKLKYDIFYFKYEHFCNHAVISNDEFYYAGYSFYWGAPYISARDNSRWLNNRWGENLTTFSFGIEYKFR